MTLSSAVLVPSVASIFTNISPIYSTHLWTRNDIVICCLIAIAWHEGTVLCILPCPLMRPHLMELFDPSENTSVHSSNCCTKVYLWKSEVQIPVYTHPKVAPKLPSENCKHRYWYQLTQKLHSSESKHNCRQHLHDLVPGKTFEIIILMIMKVCPICFQMFLHVIT